MGNMGYCRMQNTLGDLEDCQSAGLDQVESIEEATAAIELYELCQQIIKDYSLAELKEQLDGLKEAEED